ADQAVCAYLEKHFPGPVKLLSEEGEPRIFGRGEPAWTLVLDPVDGSDNFSRGLAPAAVAIALIPASLPVAVDTVEFALVGDLYRHHTWQAVRGKGAFGNGSPFHTSSVTQLEQATISCDLNHANIQLTLAQVLARARAVRAFGSAATVLVKVADGSLDAHLDLRNRLTPENFLAPALIIREAGGLITGADGNALPPIHALTDCFSIVAAANLELHATLIQNLIV
ncbi:MAG: hypothetical protein HYR94_20370, partial [Chloroflexi bacterium]|nr:hypothetical protein [Chloroflexota bacterium]